MARPYNLNALLINHEAHKKALRDMVKRAQASRHENAAAQEAKAKGLLYHLEAMENALMQYHADATNDYDNEANVDQLTAEIESLRRVNTRYRERLRNAGLPANEFEALIIGR